MLPTLAAAQIQRNELPPLPGATAPEQGVAPPAAGTYPAQPNQAYPAPPQEAYPSSEEEYPPMPGEGAAVPQPGPGRGEGASAPPAAEEPPMLSQPPAGAPQDLAAPPPLSITPPQSPETAPQSPAYAPQNPAIAPQIPLIQGDSPGAPAVQAGPLPADLWQGVDAAALQQLLAGITLPSTSPTLADLIARALAIDSGGGRELAVKVGALERAGRVQELATLLGQAAGADNPGASARYALALLALDRKEEACGIDVGAAPEKARADNDATRATFLIPAYCAAAKGDPGSAGVALQLARDSSVDVSVAASAVDRLAKTEGARAVAVPQRVDVLDYVFLSLEPESLPEDLAGRATPRLLSLIAQDKDAPAELRLQAAERAAALNIIAGNALGRAYREAGAKLPKSAQSGSALRAKLFVAVEGATAAKFRAESIDALLASAKDAGIEVPLAQALGGANAGLARDPQAATYAETGVRVAALSGDAQGGWAWADAGGDRVKGWQLLLAARDPSDPRAEGVLQSGVEVAASGKLPAPLLHRLVTVLDALNYNVPIPLWDEASKAPQPADGFLPETGALTTLTEAADSGQVGRTILLTAAALGPDGPGAANLIALGDAMRALKRVGLDAEARRLGFEALYAHWPSRGKG
ncbi:MAG: hypothetical protein ACR2J1_10100 [Methyloceanibacter sp.]|uniref:hypothetical protein n=1 Tax=Methyloceanibacter sp. TaxID=1965321 RepID=UPI003D9B4DB7